MLMLEHRWRSMPPRYIEWSCPRAGFAGADYDLQDALVESTNKSSSKAERHGQSFYDYELAGPVSLTAACQTSNRHGLIE